MGIKHFFYWFRKTYPECITANTVPPDLDVLGIDLNALFHTVAQEVFRYGNGAPIRWLLPLSEEGKAYQAAHTPPAPSYAELEEQLCRNIFKEIQKLVHQMRPRKRLILCVDGVAGAAKQTQQRQRRFRSAQERTSKPISEGPPDPTTYPPFDTCAITPGTPFMHRLDTMLDRWIRKRVATDPVWESLEVVYSSEKVPGEGEHAIVQYIRTHCTLEESVLIVGTDADLIMLTLLLPQQRAYVWRDDMRGGGVVVGKLCVDIGMARNALEKRLGTASALLDFVFLVFFVGNDFLPNVPSLEMAHGGMDHLLGIYESMLGGSASGLIDVRESSRGTVHWPVLAEFLERACIGLDVQTMEHKFRDRLSRFPDPLLEQFCHEDIDVYPSIVSVDFSAYREAYYASHFPGMEVDVVCREYIYGLQWVMHYYARRIPSWSWTYPYFYAPFLLDVARIARTYVHPIYPLSGPDDPFLQLLSVVPPASATQLPEALQSLVTSEESPLVDFYPRQIAIDLDGKRAEWEGLVLLPPLDMTRLRHVYRSYLPLLTEDDRRRNTRQQIAIYRRSFHPPSRNTRL